jgi:pilus assembly protein CpaB
MPELTTNLKNVLIAAVLAIAAVALTLIYVSSSKSKESTTSPAAYRTVLVAARDIPVGTTGTQLAHAGWLTTRRVPSDAVASGVVPSKAALATLVAITPTYHGEQIVAKRFGTSQQEGLVSTIHGTLRIFELPGDSHQLLAGTVRQGNRVDVVGSLTRPESSQTHYAVIALRDLLVVKAPSTSSTGGQTSIDLQLTSKQAQTLFWLEKNADWSLLLRPSVKPSNAAGAPVSAETITEGSSAR